MTHARDLADAAPKANFLDNVTSDVNTGIAMAAPRGMISPFAMASAPTGWLSCDGSAVSRTTYADLFAVIGTTWGSGNGSSTFNVPDLRGAFLRGTGSHGTSNMANGSDFAGPSVGSFENDQMQGHKHANGANNFPEVTGGATNFTTGGSLSMLHISGQHSTTSTPVTDGTNGTPRAGDETRPFNAGVNYCIKT
jgi:microcystin-dependent protein